MAIDQAIPFGRITGREANELTSFCKIRSPDKSNQGKENPTEEGTGYE
jgi:hypothetical protein